MLTRMILTLVMITILWIGLRAYQRYHVGQIQQQLDGNGGMVKRPHLLFFHSTYCAACAQQEHYLNQLDPQYWPFLKAIHVEHQPELAAKYNVMTVPMTILIAADQSVKHINYGLTETKQLEKQLRPLAATIT